ncbi:hypothetical protein B0H17DRAFT_1203749 [Mycena rosella]|uniref:Uncharacterized protein n=1 Tax=Mycena rosella TaxID=1033263 RepID=A0AAD7GC04_MYCRO|nr:hypothetical protein B0H17DRAFT_1203749 [Mycena rosella]
MATPVDHTSLSPVEVLDFILTLTLAPFLQHWNLFAEMRRRIRFVSRRFCAIVDNNPSLAKAGSLPVQISLHLSKDVQVLGRLHNCIPHGTPVRSLSDFFCDFLPFLRMVSPRCRSLSVSCNHPSDWEWIYYRVGAQLPPTFTTFTVVVTDEPAFSNLSTTFYCPPLSPIPASISHLRVSGAVLSTLDVVSLCNITRLNLAHIPLFDYQGAAAVFGALQQIVDMQLVQLVCDVPKLVVAGLCGLFVAPLLIQLQLDSNMARSIGIFADECMAMLRSLTKLDLGIHGHIDDTDIRAVYAAAPDLQEVDLVRSQPINAHLIYNETARSGHRLPLLEYLRLPHA